MLPKLGATNFKPNEYEKYAWKKRGIIFLAILLE
jgi:hypothetical protein